MVRSINVHMFTSIMVAIMLYYTCSERPYFTLFDDVCLILIGQIF